MPTHGLRLTAELSTSIMGGTAGRDMPSDAK